MERKTITRKDMTPDELKEHKKALQRKNSNNYYRKKKEAEERMAEVSDNTDEEGEDKPKVSKPKPKPKVAKMDKLEEKIDMLMEMIKQLQEGTLDDEEDTEEEEDEDEDDKKNVIVKKVNKTQRNREKSNNKTVRKVDFEREKDIFLRKFDKEINEKDVTDAELFLRKHKMSPQVGLYEQAVRDGLFV